MTLSKFLRIIPTLKLLNPIRTLDTILSIQSRISISTSQALTNSRIAHKFTANLLCLEELLKPLESSTSLAHALEAKTRNLDQDCIALCWPM